MSSHGFESRQPRLQFVHLSSNRLELSELVVSDEGVDWDSIKASVNNTKVIIPKSP